MDKNLLFIKFINELNLQEVDEGEGDERNGEKASIVGRRGLRREDCQEEEYV